MSFGQELAAELRPRVRGVRDLMGKIFNVPHLYGPVTDNVIFAVVMVAIGGGLCVTDNLPDIKL